MKRRLIETLSLLAFVADLLLMLGITLSVMTGCVNHPTVNIPLNAPIWTSTDITVKDPFYLAPGTNVKTQAHGEYVRPAGSLVYQLPASTQSSK